MGAFLNFLQLPPHCWIQNSLLFILFAGKHIVDLHVLPKFVWVIVMWYIPPHSGVWTYQQQNCLNLLQGRLCTAFVRLVFGWLCSNNAHPSWNGCLLPNSGILWTSHFIFLLEYMFPCYLCFHEWHWSLDFQFRTIILTVLVIRKLWAR
jgi:hypothetical protein